VTARDRETPRRQERLRREAAAWFARLRAPDGERSRSAFEAWRADDPARGQAYDRLMRRWEEASVLGPPQTMGAARRPPAHLWVLPLGLGLAGVAAGAVLVLAVAPAAPDWIKVQVASLGWPQRISTEVSQIRSLRLADGSQLVLDTDTQVTMAARRVELLRGRARFDVAQDPGRPFIVAAGGGEIVTRGGVFDVALSPEHLVAVSLVRGVVDVDPDGGRRRVRARRALRLSSGQRLAYGPTVAAPLAQSATPGAPMWPSGLLDFRRTPLSAAVAEANRYSRQKIILEDQGIGELQVSGVFKAAATADLASSLAAMFDLRLERAPNGDFVLRRSVPI
jgi:transmembrane sensor